MKFSVGDKVRIKGTYYSGKVGNINNLPMNNDYYFVIFDDGTQGHFREFEFELVPDPMDLYSDQTKLYEYFESKKDCTCGAWVTYGRDCHDSLHNPDYCDLVVKLKESV